MSRNKPDAFPPEVIRELQDYVYRLIDPRNGATFYVGRGKGNRVFSHARGEVESDSASEKIARIRAIRLEGLEVSHIIHRHGLSEDVARVVEAALMDAYPGLSNIMGGEDSGDFGAMHTSQVIQKYGAEIAEFQHKALLISVNQSALDSDLYEATRYAWRVNKTKAESAEVILATVQGLIKGAFVAERWLEATAENFPGRESVEDRYGFYGREAPGDLRDLYVGKRIPDELRRKGAANPIRYTW